MDNNTQCFPWLQEQGSRLVDRANDAALHHALLVTGRAGIGKQHFAQWLASALLCAERSINGACGQCSPCRQHLADAHPDFRQLEPEGASDTIKIDAVRDLVDWLQLTAGAGSYRVAVLIGADTLNQYAANALLKTLEEPADNAVLILTAERPASLPATIRSRCQKVLLNMRQRELALSWLKSQGLGDPDNALDAAAGAPLLALSQNSAETQELEALLLGAWRDLLMHKASVTRIAASLSELPTQDCLAFFAKACVMAVRQAAQTPVINAPKSVEGSVDESSISLEQLVLHTSNKLSTAQWFSLYSQILRLHRQDSASFRTNTVLEGLFADIRGMVNS